MFDTIVNPSSGVPRQRWTTTAMSAAGHLVVMIALVLSTIFATDVLPVPREVITFVSVAPPPPPPPPPPAVTEPIAPAKQSVVRKTAVSRPAPVIARVPVAAPVEAPDTIAPETGLEGGEFESTRNRGRIRARHTWRDCRRNRRRLRECAASAASGPRRTRARGR